MIFKDLKIYLSASQKMVCFFKEFLQNNKFAWIAFPPFCSDENLSLIALFGLILVVQTEMEDVVSVFKSQPRRYSLQTTRSWDFVNFLESESEQHLNDMKEEEEELLLQKAKGGKDVIVGVLDSGNLNSKLYIHGICCMATNQKHYENKYKSH